MPQLVLQFLHTIFLLRSRMDRTLIAKISLIQQKEQQFSRLLSNSNQDHCGRTSDCCTFTKISCENITQSSITTGNVTPWCCKLSNSMVAVVRLTSYLLYSSFIRFNLLEVEFSLLEPLRELPYIQFRQKLLATLWLVLQSERKKS